MWPDPTREWHDPTLERAGPIGSRVLGASIGAISMDDG
jgi:hypothetical protein